MARFSWNPAAIPSTYGPHRDSLGAGVHLRSGGGGGPKGGSGWQFVVSIQGIEQINRILSGLSLFQRYLQGDEMLNPAVQAYGSAWLSNFTAEGTQYGAGWPSLGASTQAVRTERGYNATSPILHQTGALRRLAVEPVHRWRAGLSGGPTVIPASSEDGTSGTSVVLFSAKGKRFTATITGAKAEHMIGKTIYEYAQIGYLRKHMPSRPFWFINDAVTRNATNDVLRHAINRLDFYMPSRAAGARSRRSGLPSFSGWVR